MIGTPASIKDSVEAHTEAIEVEPLEARTSETRRSAYGNSSKEGTTGNTGPFRQQAVPDFAPLRAADPPHFAISRRRHVVMVHIALLFLGTDRVEELVHPGHAEGSHCEDLGLAPLEEPRPMRGRY